MRLIERSKPFMNTLITIKVVQNNEGTIEINDAIEDAFGEFDRIVKKYTRFNENSELSNLNRNSGKWIKISKEFFDLIKYMLELAKLTNGNFDPTIVDFLEVYGYDKNYNFSNLDNPKVLDKLIIKKVSERPSWNEIKLDKVENKVKLAEGQKIDLGGIGKGYAIDCAFEKIKPVAKNFLIDAGGDIRACGKNLEKEIWKVQLKGLEDNLLKLDNAAVASSGSWARKVKQFHHLINPYSGKPVKRVYTSVFVLANKAIEADAWATALFIGGEKMSTPDDLSYYFV